MSSSCTRRQFLTTTAATALAAGLTGCALGRADQFSPAKGNKKTMQGMKAIEITNHFNGLLDWYQPPTTVDGVVAGDPEKIVRTAMVTWMTSFAALRAAAEWGVDAVITHEPVFYDHLHDREATTRYEISKAKKAFIESHGLVVVRNHDNWDHMPEIGIAASLARLFELGDTPAAESNNRTQQRYDIARLTLDELAARIAAKTAAMGEPLVQVAGDGTRQVSRVGIGTGCICSTDFNQEMGCDVSVVSDDGTAWWAILQRAQDEDHPVIRINHGSSEDPGMVSLTKYINDHLPIQARHRPFQGFYRLVGAGGKEFC